MPDFFGELSEYSLRKLESAQMRRSVSSGVILFLEGEEGRTIYRLVSGAVRLFRGTPEGREVTIHMVEPGDVFAEIVLFERDTYPVSAVTVEDSVVTEIDSSLVRGLLADERFRTDFLRDLVTKMRFLSQQLYVLTTMDVRERLVRFLEVRYGRCSRIEADLSKKDTAAAISVRPETLSRTLAKLTEEGLLHWNGTVIEVNRRFWGADPDNE